MKWADTQGDTHRDTQEIHVPQKMFRLTAARNILTEGKRILSNTEGTAGHAGTVAATTA